jgi:hypothetical protein
VDVGHDVTTYQLLIEPGVVRCFRVRAYNSTGDSAWSSWACRGILPPQAPPSNLTAVALDEHTIRLQWTDNSGDEEGFFFRRLEGTTASLPTHRVPANTTTHDWGGLQPGTELCVRIAAYNFGGNSALVPSTWVCATTMPAP